MKPDDKNWVPKCMVYGLACGTLAAFAAFLLLGATGVFLQGTPRLICATTRIDYTSKVKRHIIAPLGHMKMTEITADDIKMALVPVSKKSASVCKSVNILLKSIFNSVEDSKIIRYNPTRFLSTKGGGVPQKDRESLTDEQVKKLLDTDTPYLLARRAWHTESNRPIIMTELKTKAARRDIAIPDRLAECLRETKAALTSEYVIANDNGEPLPYSQFKNLWRFIIVRTAKPSKIKGFGDRFCSSTASRRHVVLRSSAGADRDCKMPKRWARCKMRFQVRTTKIAF